MRRGQTGTEYVVTISIVLVVALVGSVVLGVFPEIGSNSDSRKDRTELITGDIGIENYGFEEDGSTFVLRNNVGERILITDIQVEGVNCDSPELPRNLRAGRTHEITCDVNESSLTGDLFNFEVTYENPLTDQEFTYVFGEEVVASVSSFQSPFGNIYIDEGSNISTDSNMTGMINFTAYTETLTGDVTYVYRWYKNGVLSATMLGENPEVYLPFDANPKDYIGNSDGQLGVGVYEPELNQTGGQISGGYEFRRVGDHTSQGDLINFTSSNLNEADHTVCAWFKSGSSDPTRQQIYAERSFSDEDSIKGQLSLENNGFLRYITRNDAGGNVASAVGTTDIQSNVWYHGCGVRDGSNVYVYLNGVQEGSDNDAGGTITVSRFTAGAFWSPVPSEHREHFNGTIDELMIYNRSLTTSEISQIYNGGLAGGNVLDSSLTADNEQWIVSFQAYNATDVGQEYNSSASEADADQSPFGNIYIEEGLNVSSDSNMTGMINFTAYTETLTGDVTYVYRWYKNGVLNATTLIEDPNLALYLPFDNDVRDYSGDKDGSIVGSVTPIDGLVNGSYNFAGGTDYVDLGNVLNYERTDPFTISMWAKSTDLSTTQIFLAKQESSGDFTGYQFFSTNGGGDVPQFNLRNDNSPSNQIGEQGTTVIADGTWRHLVATYDGSSTAAGIEIYVDGVPESLTTLADTLSSSTLSSVSLQVGARNGGLTFEGDIDEVIMYNRTLTQEEVSQLYNGGFGGGDVLDSTLTADNDQWIVSFQAYNATDVGQEYNSTASEVDTDPAPPGNFNISIVEGLSPASSSNLTAQIEGSYVEALTGDITYVYRWYNNGVLNATTLVDDVDLIAYWPMDNDNRDYGGTHDVSSTSGTPTLEPTEAKVGAASYEFIDDEGGQAEDFRVPDAAVLDPGAADWSTCIWAKMEEDFTSTSDLKIIYHKGVDISEEYQLYLRETGTIDGILFQLKAGSGQNLLVNPADGHGVAATLELDGWNHICVVIDEGAATEGLLYFNNQLVGTRTSFTYNIRRAASFTWGGTTTGGGAVGRDFEGNLDELSMHDKALTPAEISQLYYGGLGGGTELNSSLTTAGETWTVSFQAYNATTNGNEYFSDGSVIQ